MVLTPNGIYSFKNQTNDYKSPTESIPLKDCSTIKSAEDEVHKENAFVPIPSLCLATGLPEQPHLLPHRPLLRRKGELDRSHRQDHGQPQA